MARPCMSWFPQCPQQVICNNSYYIARSVPETLISQVILTQPKKYEVNITIHPQHANEGKEVQTGQVT